jgi:hypothetical protein
MPPRRAQAPISPWVAALYFAYLVAIIALLWYIVRDVRSVQERFATPTPQGACFACMDYFREVFSLTDPQQVVPYVKQRAEYLKFVLFQMRDFVTTRLGECPRKGEAPTLDEVTRCIPATLEQIMGECVRTSASRADCTIISTLGDRILARARDCGATACSVEQFRTRFVEILRTMVAEIEACQRQFETPESECSKLYSQVILVKTKPATPLGEANSPAASTASPEAILGQATSFLMNEFAR